jgi:uncharacterized C2H2 Zn-finger protein
MVAPLEPIRAVKCNIDGCYQSFDSEKEMKRHKLDDPTHFFCKKCNVDCKDWADLVEHKVDGMAPWLECRADNRPSGNPPHIVCEFCGEDFKSMGGRLLHRERVRWLEMSRVHKRTLLTSQQRHQAAQSIMCPGCSQIFGRAGDMIGHLENNECEGIPDYEFYAQLQHKFMKKEIMKDLESFTENLQINSAYAPPPTHPGLVGPKKSTTHTDTETDGGVLLDKDDEEQKEGCEPLEAKMASIELGGKKIPLTRRNLEAWPRLPGQSTSVVPRHVLDQSIGSPPPSIVSTDIPASEFASQITSRRGGVKVHTESYPSLPSGSQLQSNHSTKTGTDEDAKSVSTARAENVLNRPAAWTTTNTSRALFGDSPAQPNEIESILKNREEEVKQAPNLLLNARWWDPESGDYTSDLFLHSALNRYFCPFPQCDVEPFDCAHDIEGHLLEAHAKTKFRCPQCLKLFKRAQGMVSHIESTSKCPIRQSKHFKSVRPVVVHLHLSPRYRANSSKQVLDEITGGYIKAKRLPQPTIYRASTAVVKSGQVVDGVMSTMYKAGWPNKK